jgi:hypothetical protein
MAAISEILTDFQSESAGVRMPKAIRILDSEFGFCQALKLGNPLNQSFDSPLKCRKAIP